jgi:hypothetical protein
VAGNFSYSYILDGCCPALRTDMLGEGYYPAVAGYSSFVMHENEMSSSTYSVYAQVVSGC